MLVVGGIIIGLLLAWGWTSLRTNSGSTAATSSSTTTTSESAGTPSRVGGIAGAVMVTESNDLIVPSPQKAGQSVVITQANLGAPTWVVVYEGRNGQPGNVLGAQLFFTIGPGIVTLLRETTAGQTYYVGKSVDNGDHKYAKSTDEPALNADGTPQIVSFAAN